MQEKIMAYEMMHQDIMALAISQLYSRNILMNNLLK